MAGTLRMDGLAASGVVTAMWHMPTPTAGHALQGLARSGLGLRTAWVASGATGRIMHTRMGTTTTDALAVPLDGMLSTGCAAGNVLLDACLVPTGLIAAHAHLEPMAIGVVVDTHTTGMDVTTAHSDSGSTTGVRSTAEWQTMVTDRTTVCTSTRAHLASTRTSEARGAARAARMVSTIPGAVAVTATAAQVAGRHPATSTSV